MLLVLLLLWFLLYLMSAFAAYRLKRVHPWRRRQAGWWSGSQSCACVVGEPPLHPDQDTGGERAAAPVPAPAPMPVNGVRCHCASVWVGNLYSFFFATVPLLLPLPLPCLLVMETCPHIYLCGSHFCVASLAMLNWFIIFQRCILTFPVANMRPVCLCILHLHFAFAARPFALPN